MTAFSESGLTTEKAKQRKAIPGLRGVHGSLRKQPDDALLRQAWMFWAMVPVAEGGMVAYGAPINA